MVRSWVVRWWGVAVLLAGAIFPWCFLPDSEARDLTAVFADGYDGIATVGGLVPTDVVPAVAPTIAAAVTQAVTQEFPLASVAPAFTYRYNPALSVWERSTGVPGPLFSERALTLGQGRLNFGVGYSYVDFSELNGKNLDNLRSPGLLFENLVDEARGTNATLGGQQLFLAPVSGSVLRTRLDLQAHIIVPTVRYGITDYWDVSVAVPVLHTSLRIKNDTLRIVDVDPQVAQFSFTRGAQGEVRQQGFRNPSTFELVQPDQFRFVASRRPSVRIDKAAGSSTGIGDVVLRTKYHFWRTEVGGAAVGLNVQLPTGELRNFHGAEETHVSPFLYLSQVMSDRYEPHLNLGVDFNADDTDRSSFLYAAGVSVLVGYGLSAAVDFIGRSEFGRLAVRIPEGGQTDGSVLDRDPATCTAAQPCTEAGTTPVSFFPGKFKRNDVADFSVGLRYALGTSGSVFFGTLIPLNNDGFRADFIPAGGVEYTF